MRSALKIAETMLRLFPDDHDTWIRAAVTAGLADDDLMYQKICNSLLSQFGNIEDVGKSHMICKVCLLKPGLVDIETIPSEPFINNLESRKTDKGTVAWRWATRGLLELRRGNLELAKQYTEEAKKHPRYPDCQALILAIQALTAKRENEPERVREVLEELKRIMSAAGSQVGRSSHDYLVVQLLWREATIEDAK